MKKKIIIIAVIAAASIALIAGAFILYQKLSSENHADNTVVYETMGSDEEIPSVSTRHAPDFMFIDSDGNERYLSEFFGKPIILNFWASWCGPCRREMPYFEEAYKEYADSITFLIVNLTDGSRETEKTADSFIEEEGFSFPIGYDMEGQGTEAYSIYYIPDTYFIDSDGNIVSYVEGSISKENLEENIALIME